MESISNQQLFINDLPSIMDSDFQLHPKRFLKKKLIADFLWTLPLFIGSGVLYYFMPDVFGSLGFIASFIILLFALLVAYKGFRVRGYAIREHDITYRKGWIFHRVITVPFNRIQHTEVTHGPIDRMFNLRQLDIYTAGGGSSDLTISGLAPEEALRIKEFLASEAAAND